MDLSIDEVVGMDLRLSRCDKEERIITEGNQGLDFMVLVYV